MSTDTWNIVSNGAYGQVFEKKDGSVIITSTWDGNGFKYTSHYPPKPSALNDTVDLEMYKLVMDNEALKSLNEQLCSHIDSLNKKIQIPLNDTVVEDKNMSTVYFDKQVLNPHAQGTQAYTNWEQGFMEAANKYFKPQLQSEVDAIRADTWYAARKITDKVVGEIDFKDGDRCPFYEKYFNSINDYLSSLNLNSNDTGKEDNETKSANWRSENLSKQSAPEPSALPNKEYEIVSCYSVDGDMNTIHDYIPKNNTERSQSCDDEGCQIHSVRRLSDNTVFSVGDSYDGGYKITAFKITGTTMMYECNDNECFYNIAGLRIPDSQKPPITDLPKQPVVETISSNNDDVACLSLNDLKALLKNICDGTFNDDISRWNFVLGSSSNPETLYQSALRAVKQKLNHQK